MNGTGCIAAGVVCTVADARQVKLIWQARSKTEPIDARKLAELLRVDGLTFRAASPLPAATIISCAGCLPLASARPFTFE